MKTLLLLAAAIVASPCAIAQAGEAPARQSTGRVGINLGGVTYYSTEIPFVDAMKMSKPFVPQQKGQPYGKGPMPELREDGYPKQFAPDSWVDTITLSTGGHYAGGQYVCLYEGRGRLEFRGDVKVVESKPGRILLTLTPKDGAHIKLAETDPADPVRNIRLIPQDAEATHEKQPFRQEFLKRWSNMKVIRFMDWMRTNGSTVKDWADRPKPADQTQGAKGVALEYMIQLASALKADPWFCMPHMATDDYVRKFAQMVKEKLDKDRKIYIEYSNETWNFMFPQTRYCVEQGKKLALSDNEFQGALRYHAQRAGEIFKIWEEVFGGRARLVRVLASHHANPWATEQVLSWKDAAKNADAVATAPYFGNVFGNPKTADEVAALSVEQLLEKCREVIATERKTMEKQAELARKSGVKLFAYEFGQHLVGHGGAENNEKLMNLFIAANRHPLMHDLYLGHLRNWRDVGGDLVMIFSSMGRPSKWGSWGILEYEGQDPAAAPKFRAVQEFIEGKR
jgi:hypothetical protein